MEVGLKFPFLAAGPLPGAWAPLASSSLVCGVDHLHSQVAKEVKAGDLAFMPGYGLGSEPCMSEEKEVGNKIHFLEDY